MFRRSPVLVALVACAALSRTGTAAAQSNGRDYAPFAMIDGYELYSHTETRFDDEELPLDSSGKTTHVEGYRYDIIYRPKETATRVSLVEIARTVEAQVKAGGGQILYETPTEITARFDRKNQYVWADIKASNYRYVGDLYNYEMHVNVIEERSFHPNVTP